MQKSKFRGSFLEVCCCFGLVCLLALHIVLYFKLQKIHLPKSVRPLVRKTNHEGNWHNMILNLGQSGIVWNEIQSQKKRKGIQQMWIEWKPWQADCRKDTGRYSGVSSYWHATSLDTSENLLDSIVPVSTDRLFWLFI